MIYKVDFEGQACKQIKEKAESYQYDLKSVLKGIGLLIADMWLPGDSKPQINTWEGLFEKVQEDYSYKDTIVENDFICSISNDDGISIIIEIADETIVDFKDIKSSILQVRDFLLANKWSGAIPDFLPIEQKEIRNMMNETERSIPFKCLHEAFFECAYRFPDKTALEWLSLDEKWETLSYEALKIKVLQTASMLKECDGKIEMHHQTLDIDEAFSSQLPSNFQADIVIAVGVLNNSVNTDKCIYEINSVMKPGGILLVIETVEDVPDILITQYFMMTAPKDRRKATNTMFLNRKQWLEILEENGFCNSEEFPGYGEYLEVLGQKLFYCTKE